MAGSPDTAHMKEEAAPGGETRGKIPFQFGARIKLRSLTENDLKGQATVVGILEPNAILVETPVLEEGERINGRVGGDIYCAYFHEGRLFEFKSRFGQVLTDDIVCLDYPKNFEAQQLRKHPRIKVNLEAESVIGEDKMLMNGDIRDISEGGCCLELPLLIQITTGTPVSLTFQLPNEDLIEDMECAVMNVRFSQFEKKTYLGMSFAAPGSEIVKIRKFCEMCTYFKV